LPGRTKKLFNLIPRIWIPILVIMGMGLAWQVYRVLPGWVEMQVAERSLDAGVVITRFPVESIGFRGTRVGDGGLVFGNHIVDWQSIEVAYQLGDLMNGKVHSIAFNQPTVSIRIWNLLIEPVEVPLPAVPAQSPVVPAAGDQPESQETVMGTSQADVPELEEVASASLWQQLQDLPLDVAGTSDGALIAMVRGEEFLRTSLRGLVEKQPYGTSGDLHLKSTQVAAHLSIRAPVTQTAVTLQGEITMPPGNLLDLGNAWIELQPDCDRLPRLTTSGQLMMDLFAEVQEDGTVYGSSETVVSEFALRFPGSDYNLGFNNVLVASVYKDDQVRLEGGAEVLLPGTGRFRSVPFGARFSYEDPGRAELETEAIDWTYGSLRGRSAMKGQALFQRRPDKGWARLEISIPELAMDKVSADPFSILLEPVGDRVLFKASPIGLKNKGTLWVEDLAGFLDTQSGEGSGRFSWYGLMGESMGEIEFATLSESGGNSRGDLLFLGPGKEQLLSVSGSTGADGSVLRARGVVLLDWVNTLGSWLGSGKARVSGANPSLALDLRGTFPLFFGQGRIDMDGLDLSTGGGAQLKNISGAVDLAFNMLPSTSGWQSLRIGHVVAKTLQIEDVKVEWGMPSFGELSVHRLAGRIGEGRVALEPFTLNVLNPSIQTRVRVLGLDADLLRQWLGEERFVLKGRVSGSFTLGWVNGEFILGTGSFTMDKESSPGQFTFVDEDFLRQRFASFSGVPVELRDRLLAALLEKGIRIDSLEVSLGPSGEPGQLLFRVAISGESKSELLEVPIRGFVINNLISEEDFGRLLGILSPIRMKTSVGD
jgi:hypothetical protein